MGFTNPYSASRLTLDATASINSGLVAFYPLTDETSSTALDISGNSYNGTMTNGAYFTGSTGIGRCAFFDGSNDYCTTGNAALSIDGSVGSISFWFKSNASQTGARLFEFGSSSSTGRSIGVLITSSGDVTFRYRQSSTNSDVTGPALSSLGSGWNFAVATWDASNNINLYINGTKYTGTRSGSINVGNLDRGYIAERALEVPLGKAFQGEMQNVRCWTVELSQAQVDLLYARPWSGTNYDTLWPYSPPAAGSMTLSTDTTASSIMADIEGWWVMTDGSGTILTDISGNGLDATLYGTNTWETETLGTANRFDNSVSRNSHAETANTQPDLTGGYTFSTWVKHEELAQGGSNKYGAGIVLGNSSGSSDFEVYFRGNHTAQHPQVYHNRSNGGTSASYYINNNNYTDDNNVWVNFAVTFDGSTIKIYRDGVYQAASSSVTAPLSTSGYKIYLNELPVVASSGGLTCSMQNTRLYSRCLSATEVSTLYERPWEGIEYGDTFHHDPPTPASMLPLTSDAINTDQELWLPLTETDDYASGAADISGNGANGTKAGSVQSVSGLLGTAAKFDGVNGTEINVPGLSVSQPATISLWFKTTGDGKFIDGDDSTDRIQLYFSSTYLRGHAGSTVNIGDSNEFNDDEWHHVVGVFNGSSSVFYADGVQRAAGNPGSRQLSGARVGAAWNSTVVTDNVANVRVWSRVLSADEIWSIYTNPWLGSNYKLASGSTPLYNYIFRTERFRRLG